MHSSDHAGVRAQKKLTVWDRLYAASPCALLASTKEPPRADAYLHSRREAFNAASFANTSIITATPMLTQQLGQRLERISRELDILSARVEVGRRRRLPIMKGVRAE